MTALTQNVHALTSAHLTTGPDGAPVERPALLDQLRHAAKPDRSGGGHGGSDGDAGRVPIDVGAISLEQDIWAAARFEHQEVYGHAVGSLEALVRRLGMVEDITWVPYLEQVTAEWCRDITAYLNPTKPPYRPAVPCPACRILYDADGNGPGLRVHCWGADEELLPNGEWSATCIHCDAGWTPGKQMDFLRGYMTKQTNGQAA